MEPQCPSGESCLDYCNGRSTANMTVSLSWYYKRGVSQNVGFSLDMRAKVTPSVAGLVTLTFRKVPYLNTNRWRRCLVLRGLRNNCDLRGMLVFTRVDSRLHDNSQWSPCPSTTMQHRDVTWQVLSDVLHWLSLELPSTRSPLHPSALTTVSLSYQLQVTTRHGKVGIKG